MKKIISLVTMLLVAFTIGVSAHATYAEEKYPDNSFKKFDDVETFYKSLDKNEYTEYKNAKMNIREKVYFKDINKTFSKADHFIGKTRVGGNGFNPKRQMYVFLSVSEDGKEVKHLVIDAEKKVIVGSGGPLNKS